MATYLQLHTIHFVSCYTIINHQAINDHAMMLILPKNKCLRFQGQSGVGIVIINAHHETQKLVSIIPTIGHHPPLPMVTG